MRDDSLLRLRRMANQIARNLAAGGHETAVSATCEHISLYWDPRMKAAILADDPEALDPIAREAIARLRQAQEAA